MKYTFADFFSGCGGFSHGFHRDRSFSHVLSVDNWAAATHAYESNFPRSRVVQADLSVSDARRKISKDLKGQVDIVIGGPPCQDFSTLGKRPDNSKKNLLVDAYIDLVRAIQPTVMVMENVKGLLSKRHPSGVLFPDHLKSALSKSGPGLKGYEIHGFLINTLDFGLAQTRTRFIAIGVRKDVEKKWNVLARICREIEAQKTANVTTLFDAIGDLPRVPVGGGADAVKLASGTILYNHKAMNHSEELIERLKCVPPGGGLMDVPDRLLTPHLLKLKSGAYGSGGHVKNVYGRLLWDKPCGTIVAGMDKITCGRYVHPDEHRLLTPRECARIQGYPDDFVFHGGQVTQYYLVGNSVAPKVSQVIARSLKRALSSIPRTQKT